VLLKCGHCKRMFTASSRQEKRTRCSKKHRPKFGYGCSPECVSKIGVKYRKVAKRLPVKRLAISRVQNAIQKGALVRPEFCENCGAKPGKNILGRSIIEGHHEDHSKALEVKWLCQPCHKAITPQARGEHIGRLVLRERDIPRIRKYLAQGRTGYELASLFRVTKKTIYDIKHERTWGWLK
jgi:hypothetical protein